ncbi:hypothetical protein ACFXTN_024422 [Malus domestica]
MESKDQKKLHIAMIPWLAYGHLMSFLEVSKFLAQKGHRISFISTPKNINRLRSSSFSPLIDFVELPSPCRRRLTGIRRVHLRATNQQSPLPQKSIRLAQAFSHPFHRTLGRQLDRPRLHLLLGSPSRHSARSQLGLLQRHQRQFLGFHRFSVRVTQQ